MVRSQSTSWRRMAGESPVQEIIFHGNLDRVWTSVPGESHEEDPTGMTPVRSSSLPLNKTVSLQAAPSGFGLQLTPGAFLDGRARDTQVL